ncbi:MAG: cytochrome c peroxidase, partial [Mariprofundaceae bacterium]
IRGGKTMRKTMLIAVALAFAFGSFATAQAAPEIGPLPTMKYDKKKAALGKMLFFDPRLSGDAAISCASCHDPSKGFSEGVDVGKAYPGTKHFRNAPTVINTAQKKGAGIPWFWDGRIGTSLNDVTRNEIVETIVMNMDMRIMQERLKQDPTYVKMFKDVGMGEPSNGKVRKLIPEYLKSLQSKNVPFDKGKLSSSAKKGMKLFKGKAGCINCHNGAMFSDGKAHILGVAENPKIFKDPLRHVTLLAYYNFLGAQNKRSLRFDVGHHVVSKKADGSDYRSFITPTLRELKHTAPYMHNGMLATLDDVINFYNNGGGVDPNKDAAIKPLHLSKKEKGNLKAFLLSLSGDPLTGPEYTVSKDQIKVMMQPYKAINNWLNVKN